jgi:hypothetical protein
MDRYAIERRMRERQVDFGMHPSQRPLEERQAALGEELHDIQTPETISVDPARDYYSPTKTTAGQGREKRRNTNQARYSAALGWLEVEFRAGNSWRYEQVPPPIREAFKAAESPGRYVAGTLVFIPGGAGGFESFHSRSVGAWTAQWVDGILQPGLGPPAPGDRWCQQDRCDRRVRGSGVRRLPRHLRSVRAAGGGLGSLRP